MSSNPGKKTKIEPRKKINTLLNLLIKIFKELDLTTCFFFYKYMLNKLSN